LKVGQCLRTYFSEPTYYSTKIVPQKEAAFPALTVCPLSDGYKKDVLAVMKARRDVDNALKRLTESRN